jgi:putative FmdB family regulatory protein
MPVYEFVCESCENAFEITASFSEMILSPECPECHGKDTHKKFSLFLSTSGSQKENGISSCGTGTRFT